MHRHVFLQVSVNILTYKRGTWLKFSNRIQNKALTIWGPTHLKSYCRHHHWGGMLYSIRPSCCCLFFRNKHIMIDLGTGNNNKINWTMEDKQEMIDIIETVYRGARKGRGLVVSPKDYSTKYRYWFLFFLTFCDMRLKLQVPEVKDDFIFLLSVKQNNIVIVSWLCYIVLFVYWFVDWPVCVSLFFNCFFCFVLITSTWETGINGKVIIFKYFNKDGRYYYFSSLHFKICWETVIYFCFYFWYTDMTNLTK